MINESWRIWQDFLEEAPLSLALGIEITGKKPVEEWDVQRHRGKAVFELGDEYTVGREQGSDRLRWGSQAQL